MTVDAPQSLGEYQLLALLATGGMAEIYLAKDKKHKKSEKLVVVKRIFPHLAKQQRFVDMFLDEGNIAAQLDHSNIVKIFESSKQDDEYFIAMEYLEGESLGYLVKQLRKNGRALPTPLAAGIVAQVCGGLHYAHTLKDKAGKPMNIVHRDVSPHNIIILYSGVVKLVDFGIAKAASKIHKTRVGTLKGKLTYISPEQYKSGAVDARSDVFSLGVVFWELLTRRRLFKRDTEKDMMRATLSGAIPRVRDIQAGVSPELEEVAHKALQLKPEDRYQSAADMEEAIRDALLAIGATSEDREISEFVSGAFEERAQTKQRLLREISAQPEGQEPCDVSQSEIMAPQFADGDDTEDEESDEVATPVDEADEDIMCDVPTANVPNPMRLAQARQDVPGPVPGLKIHPAVWVAIPLLVLLILGIVLLSAGDGSQDPSGQPESIAPQSAVATGSMGTATVPPPAEDAGSAKGDSMASSKAQPDGGGPVASLPEKPEETAAPTEAAGTTPRPSVLTVRSRPAGCRVKVDGEEVAGLTPQERIEVKDGMTHKVSVLCRDHMAETKEVLVSTGERITLDFAPAPRPQEPRVVNQKAPAPAVEPTRKPRPKPAARSKSGYLRLDTVPWSEVYLGDRKLGITPLVKQQLPAGTHVLTAINLGRQLKKSFKVTIKSGQITKLRLSLTE